MNKNEVINSYEKQLEVYEKITFLDARKIISSIIDEKDEDVRKKTILEVFKGTLHLVLNFIKISRYEVISSYGYDLEDIINVAYESWYEKLLNFEILKYEDARSVFGVTFANKIANKLNPCEKEQEEIFPCTQEIFVSLLNSYINMRNKNIDLTYREFIDKFKEENKCNYYNYRLFYYGLDCEACANMLEKIYLDLSNKDNEEVKINKLSIQKISKLLALSSQIYPLSNNIKSSIGFEEDIMKKLCYEQINKLVFESSSLNEREKEVLTLRFGFDDNKCHNLEEVGNKYGITRERVRQIEAQTLRKLRKKDSLYNLYKELN